MRKTIRVSLLSLLSMLGCAKLDRPPIPPQVSFYGSEVDIRPQDQDLDCLIRLQFLPPREGMKQAVFYLHRQFRVNSVTGSDVSDWSFDRDSDSPVAFMPDARPLSVRFLSALDTRNGTEITFEYGGKITEWSEWSPNVISADWVELGSYWPWFPFNADHGPFTFDIRVRIPENYNVCSAVWGEREGADWRFHQGASVKSMVLAASPALVSRRFTRPRRSVTVHSLTLSEDTVARLGDDCFRIGSLLSRWFGKEESSSLVLIESGRAQGGGYARKGLVVLGGLSDSGYRERREGYIRYLGHEMAHAWWSGASVRDWQDWINEGFAEFSALMLVRSIFGEESFRKRLENKRQNAADTAPIWGFERWDRSTPEKQQEIQAVLYDKGPVLLAELEERLGSETFLAACRDLAGHVEKNTSLLLEVISSRGGRDVASWFETQLRIR